MVKNNLAKVEDLNYEEVTNNESKIKWCSVSLLDVIEHGKRLEASVFDIEAKNAREILNNSKWNKVNLIEGKYIKEVFYPGRFKRIYVDKESGEPFYLPSQINEIYPKPEKYISKLTNCDMESLKVKKGDILLTRSGTIGNVTIVSETLSDKVFSDDVIRIRLNNDYDIGYLYTYLNTKIGKKILQTNKYGSVITHIEPEHLEKIIIPNASKNIKVKINNIIKKSFEKRDQSNELLNIAEKMLIDELQIPLIEELKNKTEDKTQIFNVKLSNINNRFDASYHVPIVDEIIEHFNKYAEEVTTISDPRISKNVILPGRFKRVYVDEGYGRVLLGGKQIYELDPSNKKYLSTSKHDKRIVEQLEISENTTLITRSGTIGKVALVTKHWEEWAASEHIIRIIPANDDIAGYLNVFLASEYGFQLITHFTYGSVVDEIDDNHVRQIAVPLLKNHEVQKKINDLALEANKKRYEAYELEQEALKIMNKEVIFAK